MKLSLKSLLKTAVLACLIFLIALATTSHLHAQTSSIKPIGLVSGPVMPDEIPPDQVEVAPDAVFDGKYFKLIQFAQIPRKDDRKS